MSEAVEYMNPQGDVGSWNLNYVWTKEQVLRVGATEATLSLFMFKLLRMVAYGSICHS